MNALTTRQETALNTLNRYGHRVMKTKLLCDFLRLQGLEQKGDIFYSRENKNFIFVICNDKIMVKELIKDMGAFGRYSINSQSNYKNILKGTFKEVQDLFNSVK